VTDYTTTKHETYPDVIVFDVTGRLDSTTSKFLLDCIEGHIDRGERLLVLDCSDLKYISSAGLESFIQTRKRLKAHGGTFAIAGVQGIVAEAIKLVHFDRLFSMFPTVDEAAQHLAAEADA
jgi:anti-sigma B factor antagonist